MPQPGDIETPQTRQPRRAEELHALADAFWRRAGSVPPRQWTHDGLGAHLMGMAMHYSIAAKRIDRDGWERTP